MTERASSGAESAQASTPRDQTSSSGHAESSFAKGDQPLNRSADSPEDLWNDYFGKRSPDPRAVRDLVMRLHEARKHDHVAAVIHAALRHGQGQPWMYEVLALTLEIQDAPKEEVERALLSQIDSSTTDASGLMMSAAYLTRFGADRPALRLYRQSSELAPERPEPYIVGLNIAKRIKDDDALAWAVNGIFATAWGEGHARHHLKAENAVADRVKELREDGRNEEAESLVATLDRARHVDLRVRLEWSGEGDLDLRVHEPNGTVCSIDAPRTLGGGVLVHDGHGPKQANCFDEYVCAAGFSGVYRLEVRHAWGDIVGKRAKLTITRHEGTKHESTKEFVIAVNEEGTSTRITLPGGRREELLTIPEEAPKSSHEPSVSKILSRLDPDSAAAARRFQNSLFRQVGGVTPVVGVGAVGYQPRVTVIPSGVRLGAQAVVSGDRRYVRLSLSPSFTEVLDVFTFTLVSGN